MNPVLMTYLECAVLSMVPVIELRGALPWAIAHSLPAWPSYALCVICNLLPVPVILLFVKKVLGWMDKRPGLLSRVSGWVEEHAQKRLDTYYKYKLLGLFILVAIPLPGTGAWTGALVASILGVPAKSAVPVILLGVAAAGLVVLGLSMGVVTALG